MTQDMAESLIGAAEYFAKINNMKNKKIIAWFSCGITSAVACKLAIDEYGADNVDIVYIGIASAHKDNARFINDCEKWYGKKIETVRSKKYEDQFEVIEETGYVNGANGARCTLELKKQVRFDLQKERDYSAQIFGFEFSLKEINRSIRFQEQYPDTNPKFPLIDFKLNKNQCASMIIQAGIEMPTMYKLGYSNNNCIGCVKGGKGYWNKIRVDFPEEFKKMADAEVIAKHSCLKVVKKESRLMTDEEISIFISESKEGKWKEKDNLYINKAREVVNFETITWIKKNYTEPLFLSELNPNEGRYSKEVMPDCGSLCDIKYVDIITDKAKEVFNKS